MTITRVERVSYAVAGFGDTLTHDLARAVPAALSFFPPQTWEQVVEHIATHDYPRAELRRILAAAAERLGAPAPAREAIETLGAPDTFVVATGQQAGFLGGPLFTLHKALTAIALARRYTAEAQGRARFVPVFWVAGDDHDLAEIDHANLLRPDGTLARIHAQVDAACHGHSACHAHLTKDPALLSGLQSELETALPPEAAAEWLALYRERDFSDAFAVLLYRWLGPLGLVVAPSPDVRPLATPLLERELDDYDVTTRLIQEAAVALRRQGYAPGFSEKARNAPHFFVEAEPSRVRAGLEPIRVGDAIHFRERSAALDTAGRDARVFSKNDLKAQLRARPELFSAAAALRAVLQQAIFPVVAAVLGPGEIAYWAQLRGVHAHFGVPWPQIIPRASLTLIDGTGEKALRKLGLPPSAPELFGDAAALSAKTGQGGGFEATVRARSENVLAEFDGLAEAVRAVDGGLGPLFDKTRERFRYELERIAEKIRTSAEQRDGARSGRLRYLASLIRPNGAPQERVLTAGQFIAQYPGLPEALLNVLDPHARDHAVIVL